MKREKKRTNGGTERREKEKKNEEINGNFKFLN